MTAGLAFAGGGTASASTMTSGEGSLTDTQNDTSATLSDATASNEVFANVASTSSYCSGGFTKPDTTADTSSSTNETIFAYMVVQCQGYNFVDVDFRIQRSRWWGWQTLAHTRVYDNSTKNYQKVAYVHTPCRAGTWSYRSEAYGRINSGSINVNNHSSSIRVTCVDKNNVNFIDLS